MRHIASLSLLLVFSTARADDLSVSDRAPTIYVDCLTGPGGLNLEIRTSGAVIRNPRLMGPPGGPWTYWEYLERSAFHLWHSGELDGALIDHPEFEPVGGRVLDNLLVIDGEVVDYETFVVVPL